MAAHSSSASCLADKAAQAAAQANWGQVASFARYASLSKAKYNTVLEPKQILFIISNVFAYEAIAAHKTNMLFLIVVFAFAFFYCFIFLLILGYPSAGPLCQIGSIS